MPTVPPLAPSVETAYHDKCKELRLRTKEVEHANDAARLRLERTKRQVYKLRLERAFLLEQLARRTSTNVEDSDGSPSPGPAVSSSTPEDKPLRSKRGHRKSPMPSDLAATGLTSDKLGAGDIAAESPAPSGGNGAATPSVNGASATPANVAASISLRPPRLPAEPFDLYVSEMRPAKPRPGAVTSSLSTSSTPKPAVATTATAAAAATSLSPSKATPPAKSIADHQAHDDDDDDDDDLVRGWKDLSDKQRRAYEARHHREMEQYEKDQQVYESAQKKKSGDDEGDGDIDDDLDDDDDDDIEMGHDDEDEDDDDDVE